VPVDAFHAKGDALGGLDAAGAPTASLQITRDAPGWYHPGRSGTLRLGPNMLAYFGELHPAVIRDMDVKGPVAAFEIFLDNLPAPKAAKGAARKLLELPPLQPVHRDFAFLVNASVEAGTVVRAARGADKGLITDVSLFDVFEGKGVAAGEKSLAIAVTLQPTDGTLTDDQIDAVAGKIVAAVEKATGGTLRA
jgi:phenylalanyl-tRNA synthetase beta chain